MRKIVKKYKQGTTVRVELNADDVASWVRFRLRQWHDKAGFRAGDRVAFEFLKRTGDLTFLTVNGEYPPPERIDETALLSLAHHAHKWAGLPNP